MMLTVEARFLRARSAPPPRRSLHGDPATELRIAAPRARTLLGAASLHDFGKVATPDSILLKPGPLTPAERSVIELHTVIGWDLLRDSDTESSTPQH